MNTQTSYIVFLCYGNERVLHECAYTLLSLSRLHPGTELSKAEIWIYTDNPGWFRSLKDCPFVLNFREVNNTTIRQWRGKIDFVHRVKVEMLLDLTQNKAGNILYVDTDTVFTHRIDNLLQYIGAGSLYMHTMEGIVSDQPNPVLKKLNRHLHTNTRHKTHNKPLHEMAMWNAGVLGFNTKYNHLLNDVLAFTDAEYSIFPKHIIEQFAFSVYFQQEGAVKAAAPYIFHYWKLKEAGQILASFFSYFKGKSWDELIHYSALIQMPALMQEKLDFYHNRSTVAHMLNKQWLPQKQNWTELVKQL